MDKKTRVIFDHDISDQFSTTEVPHAAKGIASLMDLFAGTRVDTVCWLIGTSDVFCINTRKGDVIAGPGFQNKQSASAGGWRWRRNLMAMLAAGTDPLETAIREGHKRNLKVYANYRLNDCHCWGNPALRSGFWKKHPEYRIKGFEDRGGIQAALDYSIPEVRRRRLNIIRDVAGRYDIDGFHLDFMRSPFFFSAGKARQHGHYLTDFVKEVKEILVAAGSARGKEITLSARVPKTILLCEEAGIDITDWIRREFFEFIAPSELSNNDFNLPAHEFKAITEMSGTGLYPSICVDFYSKLPLTPEQYRACALNYYEGGADGIFLFNLSSYPLTEAHRRLFTELGRPDVLAKKARHYFFPAYADLPSLKDQDSIETHILREERNNLPVWNRRMKHGEWKTVMFMLSGPIDHRADGKVGFKLAGLTGEDMVKVKINKRRISGTMLKSEPVLIGRGALPQCHSVPIPPYYQYWIRMADAGLKPGMNRIEILVSPGAIGLKCDIRMWELEVMINERRMRIKRGYNQWKIF